MLITLDEKDPRPIYLQIVQQIKHLVASRRLRPGQELPPIRDLAQELLINPNTVARAVESAARLPVKMLTLHTAGGREMMRRAVKAQEQSAPQLLLLGVTVLTSLGENDLRETGVGAGPEAQVVRLARLAVGCGLGGLVCSPLEIAPLRAQLPPAIKLVTPGIRPAGAGGGDDQMRVMTPAEAARAGANFIVVGRPIFKAADPAAAAQAILAELKTV